LIDLGFETYRAIGWRLLRETFLPSVLLGILIVSTLTYLFPNLFTTSSPDSTVAQFGEVATWLSITVILAVPAAMALLCYSGGVCASMTANYVRGERVDADLASINARQKIGALAMTMLWSLGPAIALFAASVGVLALSALSGAESLTGAGVASFLGVLGLIGATVALPLTSSRYGLLPTVVMLEGLRGRVAARRALKLIQRTSSQPSGEDLYGSVWGLVLLLIFLGSIGIGIGLEWVGTQSAIEGSGDRPVAAQLANLVVNLVPIIAMIWVCVPLWSVMSTLLYFDRRIRLEGLDIETLAQGARREPRVASFIP
jgi:hypothetical protein